MKKNITIKDVAKEAGVSIGTVDRVLHNRGRYSEITGEKVRDAVERLHYETSQIASALVNRKNRLKIGVITVNDPNSDFIRDIERGIENARSELSPFGVEIVVSPMEKADVETQKDAIEVLLKQDIDGLILLPFDSNTFGSCLSDHIPDNIPYATVINKTWSQDQLFHIGLDDYAIGALQCKLTSLYCPNAHVAVLAPNYELESTQKRSAGFINKLTTDSSCLTFTQLCPIPGSTYEEISANLRKKTLELLNEQPDIEAIYLTNGFFVPVAETLQEHHSDVKLFCHEYTKALADYMENGTICVSIYQQTALAWYLAIKNMYSYLTHGISPASYIPADFRIIIKETLPFLKAGTDNPFLMI